ncbi:hypothetical protein NVP1198B_72 [Vibrio phage 1.198.B._10N.286.54.F4]|nr:hypothetical protein NVP1198A_73 [Vibrio phage 1.198.A._10N.286.54.F4]AUR94860.1 hypothetical protein NVP1198B_72 [Vibrio phage 1.198.B._10N.286.54.F4]
MKIKDAREITDYEKSECFGDNCDFCGVETTKFNNQNERVTNHESSEVDIACNKCVKQMGIFMKCGYDRSISEIQLMGK